MKGCSRLCQIATVPYGSCSLKAVGYQLKKVTSSACDLDHGLCNECSLLHNVITGIVLSWVCFSSCCEMLAHEALLLLVVMQQSIITPVLVKCILFVCIARQPIVIPCRVCLSVMVRWAALSPINQLLL